MKAEPRRDNRTRTQGTRKTQQKSKRDANGTPSDTQKEPEITQVHTRDTRQTRARHVRNTIKQLLPTATATTSTPHPIWPVFLFPHSWTSNLTPNLKSNPQPQRQPLRRSSMHMGLLPKPQTPNSEPYTKSP